jgi:predicted nucleotidyltransferase
VIDRIAERVAASQARAKHRADALRSLVPSAVALLRSRGATRVVLFGSLAYGNVREESDVDLLVDGLDAAGLDAAHAALSELFGAPVDLVRRESARPSLIARAEAEGIDVTG